MHHKYNIEAVIFPISSNELFKKVDGARIFGQLVDAWKCNSVVLCRLACGWRITETRSLSTENMKRNLLLTMRNYTNQTTISMV